MKQIYKDFVGNELKVGDSVVYSYRDKKPRRPYIGVIKEAGQYGDGFVAIVIEETGFTSPHYTTELIKVIRETK